MFIVFQVPFADARDFISKNTYRLKKPDWITLNPYLRSEFIHRFGVVEKLRHKKKDWTSEQTYCTAKKSFKFDALEIEQLAKHENAMIIHSRRLFPTEIREIGKDSNGTSIIFQNKVIGRLEVGFVHSNHKKLIQNPLSSSNLNSILKKCISLNVSMNLPYKKSVKCELYKITKYFSSIYLSATTEKAELSKISDWWVSCGAPLLVVEYSTSEVKEKLEDVELITELKEYNIRIFFGDTKLNKTSIIKTWYVETNKKTNPKDVRLLLEGLLHINASQQSLNRIINIYDKFQLTNGTECYDKFQRYLEFSFASLFKRKRFGFPCKEFMNVLQECEDSVSKSIRDGTITKLRELGIRGNYLRNIEEFIIRMGANKDMNNLGNKIDILLLTAVKDEFDVVLNLESDWQSKRDTQGYTYYVRNFLNHQGNKFTIALARAIEMGGVSTATRATSLATKLSPSCLAMLGICAGWRNKVVLGDVIVADRVFFYDTGKLVQFENQGIKEEELFSDIHTYNIYPVWKQKAQDMSTDWKKTIKTIRPIEYELQELWVLKAIDSFLKGEGQDPILHNERKKYCPNWDIVIQRLESKGLIKIGAKNIKLSSLGKDKVNREYFLYPEGRAFPSQSNVHVAPIATGNKVIQDRKEFPKISRNVRSVLGLEMEASAIGAVAEQEQINKFIIVKAVSDFADEEKNDHFRIYAIEASYRFLMAFLEENYE